MPQLSTKGKVSSNSILSGIDTSHIFKLSGIDTSYINILYEMIAYEIQLRYVIQDKIQSETKFSPRKNLRKYFLSEKRWKKILLEKKFVSDIVWDFQCAK